MVLSYLADGHFQISIINTVVKIGYQHKFLGPDHENLNDNNIYTF